MQERPGGQVVWSEPGHTIVLLLAAISHVAWYITANLQNVFNCAAVSHGETLDDLPCEYSYYALCEL